jgi:hypothetical protein
MNIDALLAAPDAETFLEETGWLDNPSARELESLHLEFSLRFDRWLDQFASKLGSPDFTEQSAPEMARDLYFEASRLAAWRSGPGFLVLASGQHDKESPVFVSFGLRMPE